MRKQISRTENRASAQNSSGLMIICAVSVVFIFQTTGIGNEWDGLLAMPG